MNYQKEKKKWIQSKEKENIILKENHVHETVLQELFDYDWNDFKKERNYRNKIDEYSDIEDFSLLTKTKIQNYDQLLDCIEDELFYRLLKDVDEMTQRIILLRYYDYTYEEISEYLHVKIYDVYYKIRKLNKLYKKR